MLPSGLSPIDVSNSNGLTIVVKRLLLTFSVFLSTGLYGCGGGTSTALHQLLPGATIHQNQSPAQAAMSLPSGTRVYDVPYSRIRGSDGKNYAVPTASIESRTPSSVTFRLPNGSLLTVPGATVESLTTAHATVSVKPGRPVPPLLEHATPAYVVP